MQPIAIPGFTAEQIASLQAMITTAVNEAFDKHFGPMQSTQQYTSSTPPTPPTPQEAKKEQANLEEDAEITAEKQEQQPLHQATGEDDDAEHGNSMPTGKSILSAKARLCAAPTSGDPAACLSKTLVFASLTSSSGFASLLAYIRCMEGMKASGQG